MLHNESRKLLIQALDKTHNTKEVSKYFSVNVSTVYRLAKRMASTDSIETRTRLCGRKPSFCSADIQKID